MAKLDKKKVLEGIVVAVAIISGGITIYKGCINPRVEMIPAQAKVDVSIKQRYIDHIYEPNKNGIPAFTNIVVENVSKYAVAENIYLEVVPDIGVITKILDIQIPKEQEDNINASILRECVAIIRISKLHPNERTRITIKSTYGPAANGPQFGIKSKSMNNGTIIVNY